MLNGAADKPRRAGKAAGFSARSRLHPLVVRRFAPNQQRMYPPPVVAGAKRPRQRPSSAAGLPERSGGKSVGWSALLGILTRAPTGLLRRQEALELGNGIAPQPRIDLLVLYWAMMIDRESDKPSAVLNGELMI